MVSRSLTSTVAPAPRRLSVKPPGMAIAPASVCASPMARMRVGVPTGRPSTVTLPSTSVPTKVEATTRTSPIWIASAPASRSSWMPSRRRVWVTTAPGPFTKTVIPGPSTGTVPARIS